MSHAYVVSTKKDGIPITYKQAMLSAECEKWKIAMDSEMSAHYSNNTWNLVDLPKDRKAMKTQTERHLFDDKTPKDNL